MTSRVLFVSIELEVQLYTALDLDSHACQMSSGPVMFGYAPLSCCGPVPKAKDAQKTHCEGRQEDSAPQGRSEDSARHIHAHARQFARLNIWYKYKCTFAELIIRISALQGSPLRILIIWPTCPTTLWSSRKEFSIRRPQRNITMTQMSRRSTATIHYPHPAHHQWYRLSISAANGAQFAFTGKQRWIRSPIALIGACRQVFYSYPWIAAAIGAQGPSHFRRIDQVIGFVGHAMTGNPSTLALSSLTQSYPSPRPS